MMKRKHNLYKFYIFGIALLVFATGVNLKSSTASGDEKIESSNTDIGSYSLGSSVLTEGVLNGDSNIGFSNDPFSDTQWYINNPGNYMNFSNVMKKEISSTKNVDMDVLDAWKTVRDKGTANREVVVAVIDTGVDYNHPDLINHIWYNKGEIPFDKIDNDKNGYVDDYYGWDFYNNDNTVCHYSTDRYMNKIADPEDNDNHGTHVAGIIAATANNNIGIAGVASNINVKIMIIKINGGKNGDGDISSAVKAIKYATMMGADICNMSWGTSKYSPEIEEAMKESDMLFIAAAGNKSRNRDNDKSPVYPASYDLGNLISVTFIDPDGDLTSESPYGETSVDLAAPGMDIYSTIVGAYGTMSGSSMAAPQVTAIAAMIYASHDHVYAANVKEIICNNIKRLQGLKNKMIYGGIPSAYKSVLAEDNLLQDAQAPVMSFETLFDKGDMLVPVHAEDTGLSELRVVKWIFGEKTLADFGRGVNGTTIVDNQAILSKAGVYTFYASDYAGNETIMTYKVEEDIKVPNLDTTFAVSNDYKSRTVTIKASDEQSGLKRIKYMPGIKKAEEFLPANMGTQISLKDGKGSFKVKKDGVYTIFATDNRGNMVVKQIVIKTLKATYFKLIYADRTLYVGDQLVMRAFIKPIRSTDKITYESTDDRIVTVSSTGKITAISPGKAYIKATTASGLKSKCMITVEQPKPS